MRENSVHKLVISALFAALACVATMAIRVPSLGVNGYVNIGDTVVLMAGYFIGGWYGALAAGVGSALADLLAGYAMYVPGTFVIKFVMALFAGIVYQKMMGNEVTFVTGNKTRLAYKQVVFIVAGVVAEAIMVVGYLFYEAVVLGYGAAAVPAVISNTFQGITNIVLALLVIQALDGVGIKKLLRVA